MASLAGCREDEKLVRVDYQNSELHTSDGQMITETEQVRKIGELFEKVDWEKGNVKVQMNREEDLKLTFFYRYDKNMPERLEEFEIWFNDGNPVEIVDQNEHRYGKLGAADGQKLEDVIK
ncbi:hypothetical protein [Fictibacillus barbaricus]|uniref:Lipoprotein n=1 Tax=Fictibacillus barbaricus TaxID=182136 RepID=A0ABS2ZAH9_9BACL|nr:hypothetical protein [Fictibacillus barbaricus]MBN3545204.1 hypothetical protein [Fictibacillus barbaricus]